MNRHTAILTRLLEVGVDADARDDGGRTPLSLEAIHDIATRRLQCGVDADERDNTGRTPPSWAAWADDPELIKRLFDSGCVDA
jgi:ankyrin repeat protein